MGILKKLSMRAAIDNFGQTIKRFPLAMLLVIILTCYLLYRNHGGNVGDKWEFFIIFYTATGSLLAIALSLLTEDFKSRIAAVATQVVLHAAWLGISYYLASIDRFSLPQTIAVSATVVAIGLSVFLICFYRKHQEIPFWNFSIRTAASVCVTMAIGGCLTLGMLLLFESLRTLFGLQINYNEICQDIWTVGMVLLAPTLFMILIPRGENKYLTAAPEFSRFAKDVVQYLFLPLLGLYMLTLYAYAAKILLQWSLPVGNVSYLVSGSMVLMVLLIYLTYPIQHLDGNKLFKGVTRWLPVLMLPLLTLMTVAIGRRLSDYGITVSRLYLLVFNIWCYAVCLWLIFTRNKRIWLIPASFAVILFLISVGPQSIANITLRQLKGEARKAFTAAGLTQFPVSGEQYEKWLQTVDEKTAAAIDGKLDYIQDFFRYDDMTDLIAKDAVIGKVSHVHHPNANVHYDNYSNWGLAQKMDIPDGYRHLELLQGREFSDITFNNDTATIVLEFDSGTNQTFKINKKDLIAMDSEKWEDEMPAPYVLTNDEAMLVVNGYSFYCQDGKWYFNLDGLLLTR